MAEHIFNDQNNLAWGESFKMARKAPAIANRIFKTLDDAQAFADDYGPRGTAVPGLMLSVINDPGKNGVYRIVSVGSAEGPGVLEKLGHTVPVADNYNDALKYATLENVGHIINVRNAYEEGEGDDKKEYPAGLYVVTSNGAISLLGTTPAGTTDISSLSSLVATLQSKVTSIENILMVEGDDINTL